MLCQSLIQNELLEFQDNAIELNQFLRTFNGKKHLLNFIDYDVGFFSHCWQGKSNFFQILQIWKRISFQRNSGQKVYTEQ